MTGKNTNIPQLQNQNDAFLGHFNLPVRVRNMGRYNRVRKEDTSYRIEMLLGISYRDHVMNEDVRNTIRNAIGPYEELTTTVVWAHN